MKKNSINYDIDMDIKKTSQYSNEIIKLTSESSEMFIEFEKLKKFIMSLDDSYLSENATVIKKRCLSNLNKLKMYGSGLNGTAFTIYNISEMYNNTEKEIKKIINDLL